MNRWISAIRPRTLPLAVSGILMGSFPALIDGSFRPEILNFALLTAILLQVLSNLANDYGDFLKGTDHLGKRSDRALASGSISKKSMFRALVVTSVLTLASGITLLVMSFGKLSTEFWAFFGIGIIAIGAAIKYTVGKKAYGYYGFGDLAVLVFFGFIAVCGTYFLYRPDLDLVIQNSALQAAGLGFLSVGVLNINNIRDINADRMNGKITVAVMLGRKWAVIYQVLIILVAFSAFLVVDHPVEQNHWVYLVLLPVFLFTAYKLAVADPNDMPTHHKLLKIFVLLTLAFVCLYGISILSA